MKIGILSDAHGHIGAFDTAVASLRAADAEKLVYLGDAIGYIPDASVAERIRDLGIPALKGNHEAMMFAPDYPKEKEAVYQHRTTHEAMDEETRSFLKGLDESLEQTFDGASCLFVHGSPANATFGYVYPDTSLAPYANIAADAVFMGHTHHPFVREYNGKLFINVGSCGLPRDDDPRGAACLFDTATRIATIIRFSIAHSSREVLERHWVHETVAEQLIRLTTAPADA